MHGWKTGVLSIGVGGARMRCKRSKGNMKLTFGGPMAAVCLPRFLSPLTQLTRLTTLLQLELPMDTIAYRAHSMNFLT